MQHHYNQQLTHNPNDIMLSSKKRKHMRVYLVQVGTEVALEDARKSEKACLHRTLIPTIYRFVFRAYVNIDMVSAKYKKTTSSWIMLRIGQVGVSSGRWQLQVCCVRPEVSDAEHRFLLPLLEIRSDRHRAALVVAINADKPDEAVVATAHGTALLLYLPPMLKARRVPFGAPCSQPICVSEEN